MQASRWLLRSSVLLGVLIAAGAHAADPPAAKPKPKPAAATAPDPAVRKAYAAALRQGRSLAGRGKHAAAVKQFEAALIARPDDARALSELGWVLFGADQLERAEKVCREAARAAAAAHDDRLQAASLYNLGRVLEKRGDRPAAVAAYRDSLALRPSPIVRDRLRSLDPNAAAGADDLAPVPMQGPFARLDGWCAQQPKPDDAEAPGCMLADDEGRIVEEGPLRLTAPVAPWLDARVFGWSDGSVVDCYLGARSKSGWYVVALGYCDDMEFRDARIASFTAADDLTSAAGAELELTMEFQTNIKDSWEEEDGERYRALVTERSDRVLMVCGVGASGVPSCTPWALIGLDDAELVPRFSGRELRLEPAASDPKDKKKRLPRELDQERGTHVLHFP